jgi:hypothetical protein
MVAVLCFPLYPSFGVAIALSTTTLGCLSQFRRDMMTIQELSGLQSVHALTDVVFYGAIISLMWLDAKGVLFPPAPPPPAILPRKRYSDTTCISCCPICLVSFARDELMSYGEQCGHCFHESCIQEWIAYLRRRPYKRPTCPLCRQDLQCQQSLYRHQKGQRGRLAATAARSTSITPTRDSRGVNPS